MHKLLARASGRESLLSNLDLSQEEKSQLVDARTIIRATLRLAITEMSKPLTDDGHSVVPKFFTQGSWAYDTLNRQTQPPQQVDMDDGCYLPLGFIKETGKPKQAAKGYFGIADKALQLLCDARKWSYIGDNEHCCRVVINDKMHIDVPLYAIDGKRFALLKFTKAKSGNLAEAERADDTEDVSWARVSDAKDVLHATRSGGWQYSDPIAVRDWAVGAAEMTGPQLRSIWRYLKTWRDRHFKSGGPSSILLMVISEAGFGLESSRDDIKLRDVADYLAGAISKDVHPPWDEDENLNRLTPEERGHVARMARDLVVSLNSCFSTETSKKADVVAVLRSALSIHIPERPEAIEEVPPYAVALSLAPSRSETVKWAPNTQSG